jgi:Fe2+ transport system protein FeoA
MLRFGVNDYECHGELRLEDDVMSVSRQQHRHGRAADPVPRKGEPSICVLADDEPATVVRIEGGHHLAARLHNLGILPGKRIRKLGTMPGSGPVMIDCDGVRVALGRGMAEHVVVQPLRDGTQTGESER